MVESSVLVTLSLMVQNYSRCNVPYMRSGNTDAIEGYYWRSFTDRLPRDAFEGGRDANGQPIYIGQTLHLDNMVVGEIYKDSNKMFYSYDRVPYVATKNIKILCSESSRDLVWVETSASTVRNILSSKFQNLVSGGHQSHGTEYIGRSICHGSGNNIGKVIIPQVQNSYLCVTRNEEVTCDFSSFEVLTFQKRSSLMKNAILAEAVKMLKFLR